MYDKHLVTFQDQSKFYQKVYPHFHPKYDPATRIYTKHTKDVDFEFRDDKLYYEKIKDVDFTNAEKVFPGFHDSDTNDENVHEKISYYLNNNIVPGFCAENYDIYRKRNIYESRELENPEAYINDKTYNIKKDDLSIYNEKFFSEKEIDKKRKKNEAERAAALNKVA